MVRALLGKEAPRSHGRLLQVQDRRVIVRDIKEVRAGFGKFLEVQSNHNDAIDDCSYEQTTETAALLRFPEVQSAEHALNCSQVNLGEGCFDQRLDAGINYKVDHGR